MKILHTIRSKELDSAPLFMAVGFFDGMHRGHKKVIEQAVRKARKHRGQAWVLTFDVHPMTILAPDRVPVLLTPGTQRLDWIEVLGVDGCILLPFTRQLSKQSPDAFARQLSTSLPQLREVFVGQNWRFGHRASGDAALLKILGRQYGFDVTCVKPVMCDSIPISSTRIREAIHETRLGEATRMLGHAFSVTGKVGRGHKVGKALGFATANITPDAVLSLPLGVYAARVKIGKIFHLAVANLGVRPTFQKPNEPVAGPQLEVHILDYSGNLYGKRLTVLLQRRLRKERRFPSPSKLKQQIQRDIMRVRSGYLRASGK